MLYIDNIKEYLKKVVYCITSKFKALCLIKQVEKPKHKTLEELQQLDKFELEAYGRTIGIELDRRRNKYTLIAQLLEHAEKNV
jgi:hypothetical protein